MIEICPSGQWRPALQNAFDFAQKQVKNLVERDPDFYPMYTQNGHWRHTGEAWTHWCDGFLPGMMWIFHARTGDAEWSQLAERYTRPLEPRKMDRNVHDLGFIFLSTYHRWHKQTGEKALNDVVIQAGQTLALRFKEKGEYMSSFMGPDSLFIDIMANVGIIFYAALQTGDKQLLDVAMKHSLTSRRVLIRGDGSSSHEGMYDLETGEFLRQTTQQGYRGDSCWSRGLAWAIYGFTSSYNAVRDARFLETAETCADFYIRETPADGVPLFDYDLPEDGPRHLDSSAAAIVAAALLRLAKLTADPAKGVLYDQTARHILLTLSQPPFLATEKEGWEGILAEGVYHLHKGLGVNESVMWGEYFFVEALDRALRA
ncbi:MAG: glycoside hydrolase family 88 protein [Acidobacteria bacterium]|nr:glycoside hydrolase family 88 protein [Acidobacteriota bacterium]